MSKVECSQYESCLSNLNSTVINNLQEIRENATQSFTPEDGQNVVQQMNSADEASKKIKLMLCQMTKALETIGMVNPYNKVYYLVKPLDKLSLFMALYTMSLLQEMRFDTVLSTLRKIEVKNQTNKVVMDGPHLIVGILTVFK